MLGDSRFPETTQFDMVRAFAMLAQLRVLPFKPDDRLDIVPADYVSKAIVHIHMAERPRYPSYNLSSGTSALTYKQVYGDDVVLRVATVTKLTRNLFLAVVIPILGHSTRSSA